MPIIDVTRTVWVDFYIDDSDGTLYLGNTVHTDKPSISYKASRGDNYIGSFPSEIKYKEYRTQNE